MNITFNLGHASNQNILIMEDEFGIIEAHTYSRKDIFENEIELATQYDKKIIFKQEAETI